MEKSRIYQIITIVSIIIGISAGIIEVTSYFDELAFREQTMREAEIKNVERHVKALSTALEKESCNVPPKEKQEAIDTLNLAAHELITNDDMVKAQELLSSVKHIPVSYDGCEYQISQVLGYWNITPPQLIITIIILAISAIFGILWIRSRK